MAVSSATTDRPARSARPGHEKYILDGSCYSITVVNSSEFTQGF